VKVKVIESFETVKGIIQKGEVIEITDTMFLKLYGKVERIYSEKNDGLIRVHSNPTTGEPETGREMMIRERLELQTAPPTRKQTMGMVADAILQKTVADIQIGGTWQVTPDVRLLEDQIDVVCRSLEEGISSLQAFRETVERWRIAGTSATRH
jgi:hypothetical protein